MSEHIKKYEEVPNLAECNLVEAERRLLKFLDNIQGLDPRWKSIAKTHFEQGFMAFRRAFGE